MSTQSPQSAPDIQPAPQRRSGAVRIVLIVAGFAVVLAVGIVPRLDARAALQQQTEALAVPTVQVTLPTVAPVDQTLVLPGDIEAYQQTPIFARTNGYLKAWYADIGTHVKAGQLLATIDAPEVDAALRQARADEQQAQANDQFAQLSATRWQQLVQTHAVSQQDTDMKSSDAQAKHAALLAAQSNVARLAQLQSYEKVYAPFDGVITARNIDVGALIDSGASGGSKMELFHLAETDKLRVFADVPQAYAQDMQTGVPATLTLPQRPDRPLHGTVARTSGAINSASRTLRVEVDVDNRDGSVLPGAYALVDLEMTASHPLLSVPVNTLLFRPNGVQVAVVDGTGKVLLRTVTLGRDFGTTVEVTSGLDGSERVIANPGDAIAPGDTVRVVENQLAGGKPSKSPSA